MQPKSNNENVAILRQDVTLLGLTLTTHVPENQEEILSMYRLANSKGFIVMDMLSRQVGRIRFDAIVRRFVKEHAETTTSWREFRQFIEDNADSNIEWFFEQWFERIGAPTFRLHWDQKGETVSGSITQPAPFYRAEIEIELSGKDGCRLLKSVEIRGDEAAFEWFVPFKVESARSRSTL